MSNFKHTKHAEILTQSA